MTIPLDAPSMNMTLRFVLLDDHEISPLESDYEVDLFVTTIVEPDYSSNNFTFDSTKY